MNDIMRKLSSRKLWAAIAGVVVGLSMVFGLDENVISTVAGAVVSVMSVITYIVTEGKVDAESVKNAINDLQGAAKVVEGSGITVVKSTTIYDANQIEAPEVITDIAVS